MNFNNFDPIPTDEQMAKEAALFDKPAAAVNEAVLESDETYIQMGAFAQAIRDENPDNVFAGYISSLHDMRADVARRGAHAVIQDVGLRYSQEIAATAINMDMTPQERASVFQGLMNTSSREVLFQAGQDALQEVKQLGTDDEIVRAQWEPMGFREGYARDMAFDHLLANITEEAEAELAGRYAPDGVLGRGRRVLNGLTDLGHMIVPFTVSESRIGNIEEMDPPSFGDRLLPGQRQLEEITWVHQARTPEEFKRRAMMYIAGTQEDDRFLIFAQENEMEMIQRVRDLRYGVDPLGANLQAALDNSVVGALLWKTGKAAVSGVAGLARRSGSESAATRIVDDALREAEARVNATATPGEPPKVTPIPDEPTGTSVVPRRTDVEPVEPAPPGTPRLGYEPVAIENQTNRLSGEPQGPRIAADRPPSPSKRGPSNASTASASGPTKTGMTVDEAVDESVHSAFSPHVRPDGTGVTKGAQAVLTAQRIAQKAAQILVGQIGKTHRLTADEFREAVQKAEQSARKIVGDRSIIDIDEVVEESALGITESYALRLKLGNEHGGHFADAEDAYRWAQSKGFGAADEGLDDGFVVMQDPDHGGWAVHLKIPVDETGVLKPIGVVPDQAFGLGRFLLHTGSQLEETLMQKALVSEGVKNRLAETLTKTLRAHWRPLSNKESKATQGIIARGVEEQKWYTEVEFRAIAQADPRVKNVDQMWNAYNSHRVVNDIEWALRNDVEWRALRSEGYESVSLRGSSERFGVKMENGRVSSNPTTNEAFDFSTGKWVSNPRSAFAGGQWVDQKYVTVKFARGLKIKTAHGEEIVHTAVVKTDDLARSPLRRQQLGYSEGGHRMYSTEYRKFVKQAHDYVSPRTGQKTLVAPRTYLAGKTEKEVAQWVTSHNTALDIYNASKAASLSRPDTIAALKQHIPDASSFIDDIEAQRINPNYKFQTVNNRLLPSEYDGVSDWAKYQDRETVSMANTHGRMYYSGKGDALRTATGQEVTTLAPLEAMSHAVGNISKHVGLSEYRARAINQWMETYGTVFGGRGQTNTIGAFMNPNWAATVSNPATLSAARKSHRAILRTLETSSQNDRQWHAAVDSFLDKTDLLGPGVRIPAASVGKWWKSNRFVDKFRGMTHSLTLGLFDLGQFPLQVQTAVMAASIDPVKGVRAMGALPLVRAYVSGINPTDPKTFMKFVGDKQARAFGYESAEEMAEMAAGLRGSGFLDFQSSHMLIGDMSPTEKIRGLSLRNVGRVGSVIFNEAETVNRITAWQIGWQRIAQKNPGLFKKDARGFLEAVQKEAETFAASMSSPNRAAFQQAPVLNYATQFLSYQVRILEMAFGKQLSRTERLRLILGQAALYGTVGVPVGAQIEWAMRRGAAERGDQPIPTPDSVQGIFRRGLVDTAIFMASGGEADVMFGERASVLNTDGIMQVGKATLGIVPGLGDFFDLMARPTPDKSFSEVMFGATGSIVFEGGGESVGNLGARMGGALLALGGLDTGQPPLRVEDFKAVARNISSFSDAERAWVAFKLGEARSRDQSKLLMEDVGEDTAWSYLFGVQSSELSSAGVFMEVNRKRTELVDKWVDIAVPLYQKTWNSFNNEDDFNTARRELNSVMAVLREADPIMYRDVMNKVRRKADAVLDGGRQRVEERAAWERLRQEVNED